MFYAQRGIGKTFLALSIACAVAVGMPILCWKVPKPRRVVYVDGEMSGQTIKVRLEGIICSINVDFSDENNLKIINVTLQNRCLDLSLEEDQKLLEPHLRNVDLLVLDNISTLTSVKENDADSWLDIQKWLIGLR
jgi:putative DNA primase/helicase